MTRDDGIATTRDPASRPAGPPGRGTAEDRRRPAGRGRHRAVRRRQDGRREAVRGPRLRRRGQPARRAAARPRGPGRHGAASGSRAPPSCSTCGPATCRSRSAPCAAPSRAAASGPVIIFLEARDDVLIRRFTETRHRHPLADERGIAASIALERAMLESVRAAGRRRARHERPLAARAARANLRAPRRRPRLGSPVDPAHQLRVQVRRAARGGPRAGRPVHEEPALHRGAAAASPASPAEVREYVLGQPIADAFLAQLEDLLDLLVPGLRRGGQDPPDDRDRLHRRLPPLDRDVRGAGGLAAERDFGPVAVFHRELER